MEFISLYYQFIKYFIKARMEYRISFFSGFFSNFYCYFITFLSFWVIVNNFGSIAGWTFEDLSLLYGLNLLTYALAGMFFWPVFRLETEVTSGNLDGYLIRPLGVIRHLMFKQFGDTFLGQVVVTLLFIVRALIKTDFPKPFYWYLFLILIIVSGALIQSAAMIFIGSLSFWMNRSSQLGDILYYDLRKFTEYPLSIFPDAIKIILSTVVPWALICYYPLLILLNKARTPFEWIMGGGAPLCACILFWLALVFFNKGLRRYSGSGS
ncbi:ABC transporter permease [Paenibacillus sp. S150]|uniref:ABC transporter permease n=1 Tax=Paenibacillus sp. S150 TaxID=2749826 RepID=UPI001C574164|nr:ABC-2 family transporter protein [Paenibacillus sp. S150]MBW4085038.1 ABC-2 family transporter protein [Paenibacillus sp. S150]